jgi:LL-diaminopimelate aminotransferase
MATLNKNYKKLGGDYLFAEIKKRVEKFKGENPKTKIIHLSIGDTTRPLPPKVVRGLGRAVEKLSDKKTYTGYGEIQGSTELRRAFVKFYKKRKINLGAEEIFISSGAKPDTANIASIFGLDNIVAITDPVYPVYLDSNVIAGRTGKLAQGRYGRVVYMDCNEKNNFIPSPPKVKVDIIYLCNPNNPTGSAATRVQLKAFVDYALKNKAIIIFDVAYAEYISDKSLPKSIYEIPGAKKCAVEMGSFSKWAGFTGVRLGWTVVPMDLVVEGIKKSKAKGVVNSLWARRVNTMFNGASNLAQEGGLAVLSSTGQKECKELISYYMNNAKIIKRSLEEIGFKVFGGEQAPYVWVKNPKGLNSWTFFDKLLKEAYVVGVPGVGFGQEGEGYLRLSAFGSKGETKQAMKNIKKNLKL